MKKFLLSMMMLAVVFANADAKWVSGDCQVEIIAPGVAD